MKPNVVICINNTTINKVNVNKTFIKSFKYLFFAATLLFLYFQVFRDKSVDEVFQFCKDNWSLNFFFYSLLAFLLMFVNWGLEAFKWQLILKESHEISFFKSMKAVFSGNSTAIFTPNRLGAFIGRILHLPENLKTEGTITTWIGNAAQLIATLIFGSIGTYLYWRNASYQWNFDVDVSILKNTLFYFSISVTIIALIGYFLSEKFITWFSKISYFKNLLVKLEKVSSFSKVKLVHYLFLSILRYIVFVFQFYFLFHAFNAHLNVADVFVYVGVLYIVIAFMPTMFGKFGVRESVLLILLSHLPFSDLQIISTSFTLWLINTIFPALLGSFFLLNLKTKD